MENNNKLVIPLEIYSHCLTTINSIKFSKREIDILACILSGRSAKGMAQLLSISPKTAETHTYNIMQKLGCTSRESTIFLLENSDKFSMLKNYYVTLLTQINKFDKILKEIAHLNSDKNQTCLIVYCQGEEKNKPLLNQIKDHLILAGITTTIEAKGNMGLNIHISSEPQLGVNTIYVITKEWQEETVNAFQKVAGEVDKISSHNLVLCLESEKKGEALNNSYGVNCISYTEHTSYYFSFFEILKKLLPTIPLESIIEKFKQQCESTSESPELKNSPENMYATKTPPFLLTKERYLKKKEWVFLSAAIAVLTILSFGYFWYVGGKNIPSSGKTSIRSELILPNESTLLNRPNILAQINDKFKKQDNDIQSIALVGIGGAGKTTVAREYARQQKGTVVWEINGETPSSLVESFENLARALATTAEDKRVLRDLTEINNLSEREKKLLEFVKIRLKPHSRWFLIYDNVEKFADVQKYFPLNSETWGLGKVIITTRDSTIQNNGQINHVIYVGELDKTQKLNLFTQIMGSGENNQLTSAQQVATINFLEKIPPFPLDVSVAAYYLKTTNIPYANYLEYLNKFDKNFTIVQENLLKGAGEYTKTRYGIITLSLKQIMNIHKDFDDLLLFISLLDSQHIPRDLLTTYKNDTIVDNFIYHLKEYSLISDNSSSSSIGSAFSMHRSTQDISFSYLTELLKLDKEGLLLKTIVYTLDNYLDQAIEQEDFLKMQIMAHHLEKVLNHRELLTDFSKGLLESKLGRIYYFTNADKSHQLLDDSLKKLTLGPLSSEDNSRLARSLLHIGAVYTELRLDKEAEEVLERATHIYVKQGSKTGADLSWALSHMGDLQKRLGNYERARDYLEESIRLHKQYGTDNKNSARTLAYLGSVYRGLGFYQKAIDTLEESLVVYKKNDSNDHIRIGWILIHLGNVHRRLGNLKEAKDYLERGLIIFQKHFPENHVSMGLVLAYLGGCYRELGDYKKSCDHLEQSLRIHQKYFDENHVKMGWILFHLASTYKAMGESKAQTLFDKVLEIYVSHCDEDNIETARSLRNMAKICIEKNRLEDADNYIQRSLKILRARQHVETYRSLKTLGEILLKKSVYAQDCTIKQDLKNQAIKQFNEALKIAEQYFPKDSVHIQKIHAKLKSL